MIPKNLHELVTFAPNKRLPIHNWFYFKEGFAQGLVKWLIEDYKLKGPILDPFCGVGTTLLTAKEFNLPSIGFDVSPLAVLVSKAKTHAYDLEKLRKTINQLKELEPEFKSSMPDKRIRKLFYSENLQTILGFKQEIEKIKDERLRDFLMLALIDTTGRVARVKKMGRSLRKVKKPRMPVKKFFLNKCERMLKDLEKASLPEIESQVFEKDARLFELEENSMESVITSPPYLNKIEYTAVYKLELGLFFKGQETRLRAYIADEVSGLAPKEGGLPLIAQAYFEDLEKVLKNIFHCLKPKGKVFVVVGGGCFPETVVQSDGILAEKAKKIGFNLVEIIPARWIQCVTRRTIKVGKVRESIVVLEKP